MHVRPSGSAPTSFDTLDPDTLDLDMLDSIDPTEELVVADMDDLPTVEEGPGRALPAGAARPGAVDLGSSEVLSTSLPVNATDAFEAFCDADSIPRWLSVVQSVRVLSRNLHGRPERAAFVARLRNGTIGYTLFYRYSEGQRLVSWRTEPGSMTHIAGRAQFIPLGARATLMQYQLLLELAEDDLSPWEDPFLGGHATSVVMNDFREYAIRILRRS